MDYIKTFRYIAINPNGDCYLSSNQSKLQNFVDNNEFQIFETSECLDYFVNNNMSKYPRHIFSLSIIRFHHVDDEIIMTHGWKKYKFTINKNKVIRNCYNQMDLFTSFKEFTDNLEYIVDTTLDSTIVDEICQQKCVNIVRQNKVSYLEVQVQF